MACQGILTLGVGQADDARHIVLPHTAQGLGQLIGHRGLQPAGHAGALLAGIPDDPHQLPLIGIVDVQHIGVFPQLGTEDAVRAANDDQGIALPTLFQHADLPQQVDILHLNWGTIFISRAANHVINVGDIQQAALQPVTGIYAFPQIVHQGGLGTVVQLSYPPLLRGVFRPQEGL